ncbi:ABC transporter-like [Syntrophomonas zehnderi OL-4]|uniref:ABC transporter-like n=1 Tax=Syntrophomonas zehnderi OL-4 TaxID=690567 RepID=A0A0E4GAU9_9FIRM|nr:ATP-binding cassette domain-containing protein [Syntrophomonas zehnderi]CFX22591.1 ABC transporter-like [Syntrophomonas zehnderi OL-4]
MLKLENIWMQISNGNGENKEILKGINLEFEQGKLYAITGPNGGGKTSLAKVIMGIYQHSQGSIYLHGEEIGDLSVTERARKGIAYAFQQPPRFKGLTIKDMLNIAAPQAESMQYRKYLRDVGLCPEDYLDRDLGPGLSGGEIKRIEMAQLLMRDTALAIFDEPEAGVDLWTIQKLIGLIVTSYRNNPAKTAIVITHNEKILPICDEVIVLEEGTVAGRGTPSDIWHLIKDDIECKVRNKCQGEVTYEIK